MTHNRYLAPLLWVVLFLASAYLSLQFDHPGSRAPYVWLPAGVSFAALLLSPRRQWPVLLVVLGLAQFATSVTNSGAVLTAVVLAVSSIVTVAAAAWVTKLMSPDTEGLRFVAAFLVGAVVKASLSTVLGFLWLVRSENLMLGPQLRLWWASAFVGMIVATPVLTSWAHFRPRRSGGPRARDMLLGALAYALLVLATLYVFDGDTRARFGRGLGLGLTDLPAMFTVIVALLWGPRGGALAILTLTLMVLTQTAQGDGPFVSGNLQGGQPLLEAQLYLGIAGILVLLVNTLRSAREKALGEVLAWRSHVELALAGSGLLMYWLDTRTGVLRWSGDVQGLTGVPEQALSSVERVLDNVHDEDRQRLAIHWAARRGGALRRDPVVFRYRGANGRWCRVTDTGSPLREADDSVTLVAGTWKVEDAPAG